MAFCPNCGTNIPEGANCCPSCGKPVDGKQPPIVEEQTDFTENYSAEERTALGKLAALQYISIVFAAFAMIAELNSKFIRFHANQVLVLTLFYLACGVVAIIPFLGWVASGVGMIVGLVWTIMGFVRAWKGEARFLPLIGKVKFITY
ncbi:MAG TPA: hypothetical protein PLU82_02465 [Oscillospiraceae bacterium]|nr:hypothetical protein [Oscillospiraceae bacterium]